MQTETDGNEAMNRVLTDLLENLGVDSIGDMDLGEAYKIDMTDTVFMDLHVEKTQPNRLSVAHYDELNGDPLRDPEIVFKPVDGQFVPVEIQRHTVLGEQYDHDPNGIAGVDGLLETWANNLREQGHVEAANDVDGQLGA